MDEMKSAGLLVAASAVGMVSLASSVEALTIVNRDARTHVLRIIEGDNQRVVRLEPSQQAGGLCSSNCNVNVDDDPAGYLVAAGDVLSIQEGELLVADEPSDEPLEEPIEN